MRTCRDGTCDVWPGMYSNIRGAASTRMLNILGSMLASNLELVVSMRKERDRGEVCSQMKHGMR